MKIGIIGASAAGLYAALLIKRYRPHAEVTLFDRMDKPGKKLLATGNGHCNLLHNPFSANAFNNPSFVEGLLKRHSYAQMVETLEDLGIALMQKGELLYPLSYSASAHVRNLVDKAAREGVSFYLNATVKDVAWNSITTDEGTYEFDDIVFAFGGMSQKNLGSDGSMFEVLKSVGYKVTSLRPSLCPLACKEVGKTLFGVRHGAKVSLIRGNEIVYEEVGEVQFKKDALSGIAVMNASSFYRPGDVIVLDLFPELSEEVFDAAIRKGLGQKASEALSPILEKALSSFVLKTCKIQENAVLSAENCVKIAKYLHHMEFHIDGLFDFESSQVTRGGIALSEVDSSLRSVRYPHHHFVGECLDVDGLCGGYNLGFALLSAMEVAASL